MSFDAFFYVPLLCKFDLKTRNVLRINITYNILWLIKCDV